MNEDNLKQALEKFIDTIEATGGVIKRNGQFHNPHYCPAGDEEWLDLGDCYMDACSVLGREPVVVDDTDDEEDDDE